MVETSRNSKFQDSKAWSGEERRAVCQVPEVPVTQEFVEKKFNEITSLIKSGVPDGDMDSHRRYHELLIRRAERSERLQQAIIEKTLASLVWGALAGAGYMALNYLKTGGQSHGL